jgi:HEAT repeat protein
VEHKELQAVLRKAVQGIANENRSAVVELLSQDDPVIAAAAARLAGQIQVTEAGPALVRLLRHEDPAVRLAAIEAATTLKASVVAGALESSLEDSEREVRIAAARALGELRYSPAQKKLAELVRSRQLRVADVSEKVAVFEAYGMSAQEAGVPLLDELLNRKGLLGKRESSEIRAAAALGLGRIATPEARASLERATQDDDPVVRANVNRALRHED